jgi:hypothetical protein
MNVMRRRRGAAGVAPTAGLSVGAVTLMLVVAGFSSPASANNGQAGEFAECALPSTQAEPVEIVAAADGAMWFTESTAGAIGRITATGAVTEYPIPTAGSAPDGLTVGTDGSIWFAETRGDKVGQITLNGSIIEFTVPTTSSNPTSVAAGSDGNVWFTTQRMTDAISAAPEVGLEADPSAEMRAVLLAGVPFGAPLSGHTAPVWWGAWGIVADRPILATGSEEGTVRMWEVIEDRPTGRALPPYRSDVTTAVDQLARVADAAAVAELITARSAQPPLAAGLFGD